MGERSGRTGPTTMQTTGSALRHSPLGRPGALTVISSMATRHVLADLARDYEGRTGTQVAIEAVGGVDAARRVADGEPFDVVVLAVPALRKLAAASRVDGGSEIAVARSPIAVAVRSGSAPPSLATADDLRAVARTARAIGYSTGPSGEHVIALLRGFGIDGSGGPRLVQAAPGVPVATLIARGEVDLGFQQLSELMDMPDVAVAGLLPDALQVITVFAAAATVSTASRGEVDAFLAWLASPETAQAKRRHGMAP